MPIWTCKIVLVRPRNPNNLGAAARAMKNFGLRDLAVVAPYAPTWDEARSAVGAEDVLATARVIETLAEAVAECTLVVGTADHSRLTKTQMLFTPSKLRHTLAGSHDRMALVFGPEKTGLSNADLSFCHHLLSIPTQPNCPSMNLGQAVAICCYELMREREDQDPSQLAVSDRASIGEIEGALSQAVDVLKRADFFNGQNRHTMIEELRRSLIRLRLTRREVTIFRGALRQIGWKLGPSDQHE